MRTTLLAVAVALGIAASASAQAVQIEVSNGEVTTRMTAEPRAYTTGSPWAAVPARALRPGQRATVTEFRIRSWKERDGVRAVVFAVNRGQQKREEQIASVFVGANESVDVRATEKFNAERITLTVGPSVVRRYRIETLKPAGPTYIDTPIEPWQPPPRQR